MMSDQGDMKALTTIADTHSMTNCMNRWKVGANFLSMSDMSLEKRLSKRPVGSTSNKRTRHSLRLHNKRSCS